VGQANTKIDRIAEQVQRAVEDLLEHRLGPYFQEEGAGEVEKKKKIAELVHSGVVDHADGFGELLYALQPRSELLRRLYLRADASPAGEEAGAAPAKPRRSIVDTGLLKQASQKSTPAPASGRALEFAKSVMSEWIKQVRNLGDHPDFVRLLGPADVLQALAGELITAADRFGVEKRLVEALRPLEEKSSTTKSRIVDQQVLLARRLIADFVDELGLSEVPLAERPASPLDGRKLFQPPERIAPKMLPRLPAEETQHAGMYILEWLEAFRSLAIDNAGHSAGREITPAQNQRLGEILAIIRGTRSAAA
jgi:hypothetical protein